MSEETKTLLQQILAATSLQKTRSRWESEEYSEIALAWLKGEVKYSQITKVAGIKGSNVYNFVASGLKGAYLRGKLKIQD